ncbi:DUF1826 domain-containing protein [Zoogloea sp. LCSB751]|uniref:DUF1826 domain-containing protein n=1 Tax=Zoogloea sp. LCSB751 TaxID=1965277 RepID=UPI0009A4E7C7|nr:DUF1826 domain-containing protein [Zoogloea sp. LCSB751]
MNAPTNLFTPTSRTVITSNPAALIDIFQPDVQLAVWQRPIDQAIADYLEANRPHLGRGLRSSLAADECPHLAELPVAPGRDALAADMGRLAELLRDLLDCPHIGLRLEVIGRAMCPRFHVDRVGIRLLCTYRGPGTEWIADTGANRARLGSGACGVPDDVSGLMGADTRIESIASFSVALLKGSLWQGNAGRGIIHRSPAVPVDALPRVVLALDGMW